MKALKEENRYLNFDGIDTDNDGYIDKIDWIVPHLSTQTFEIILINHAEHLDTEKTFVSNIYSEVKELDKIYSEKIYNNEYVRVILDAIKKSKIYEDYVNSENENSLKADLNFVCDIYKSVIAPNDKLFDYFESQKLSWVDDIPFVNTLLLKNIKKINADTIFNRNKLYRDQDDEDFVTNLFRKTASHHLEFNEDIDQKTPNWDTERIAEVDFILMKMALIEFVYFPSIPTRVTINEYIEIAKDYSTSKSSFFINGVLDKLLKEYTSSDRIQKIGRGLL